MGPVFQCGRCNVILKTRAGLKNHIERTHDLLGRRFECTECEKSYKHQSNLIQHRNSFHLNDPIKCVKCEKTFRSRGNLKRHIASHVFSVAEFDEVWMQHYVSTPRQAKAAKLAELRKPKRECASTEGIKVSSTEDIKFSQMDIKQEDESSLFTPLIYKASKVEELRCVKLPNFTHLRLGRTINPGIVQFRQGKRFPFHFLEGTDHSSFNVFGCEKCGISQLSRFHAENHYNGEHGDMMETGKFCEICMKFVDNMAAHLKTHRIALTELQRFSFLPQPINDL